MDTGRLDDMDDWVTRYRRPVARRRSAVFLDRDGTIIENVPYLNDPAKVVLFPGVRTWLRAVRQRDVAIVVVTNQSGVARRHCTPEQYNRVEKRVHALLGEDLVDAVYACPYLPEGSPPYDRAHHWRKPGDGMLRAAATDLDLDLSRSIMIGDSFSDMEAGARAGVARLVHVLTGHGAVERASVTAAFGPGTDWERGRESALLLVDSLSDLNLAVVAGQR